jgi:hypothetical protein
LMIMLFCHAGNRAAFLIYLAALCVAALSRHGRPVEVSDRVVALLDALGRALDRFGSPKGGFRSQSPQNQSNRIDQTVVRMLGSKVS